MKENRFGSVLLHWRHYILYIGYGLLAYCIYFILLANNRLLTDSSSSNSYLSNNRSSNNRSSNSCWSNSI